MIRFAAASSESDPHSSLYSKHLQSHERIFLGYRLVRKAQRKRVVWSLSQTLGLRGWLAILHCQ